MIRALLLVAALIACFGCQGETVAAETRQTEAKTALSDEKQQQMDEQWKNWDPKKDK